MSVIATVRRFIEAQKPFSRPLLLGYSGGPDSKALLYALLEIGGIQLELAHVDHGWRPTSGDEALGLAEEAKRWGLPFHLARISPAASNREEDARDKRRAFFASLMASGRFEALLLAHHRQDRAETALKRLFEGAQLSRLFGMEEITPPLPTWRPLLPLPKSAIHAFLAERQLIPLIDPSNLDPAYLRGKMRASLFPLLEEQFGKRIEENLSLCAERSSELKQYLDKRTADLPIFKGPFGTWIDCCPPEPLEQRHLLPTGISRHMAAAILQAWREKKANCRFHAKNVVAIADRGRLFLLPDQIPHFGEEPIPLQSGEWRSGQWRIQIRPAQIPLAVDWKAVWQGEFTASTALKNGALHLKGEGGRPLPAPSIWEKRKVPAWIRPLVPQALPEAPEEGEPAEFLSGRTVPLAEWHLEFKCLVNT